MAINLNIKQISYTTLVILFVLMAGFGFIIPMTMDGHHHTQGCPFMPGEQSVCMMTPLDHISAWQSTFTTLLPETFTSILFALFLVAVLLKLFRPPDKLRHDLIKISNIDTPPPLYQQLFSQGLLNPKIP